MLAKRTIELAKGGEHNPPEFSERRSPRSPSPFFTTVLALDRRSTGSDRPTSTWRLLTDCFRAYTS
jgi:hypothetical protein